LIPKPDRSLAIGLVRPMFYFLRGLSDARNCLIGWQQPKYEQDKNLAFLSFIFVVVQLLLLVYDR
jgi:hypothetical protein